MPQQDPHPARQDRQSRYTEDKRIAAGEMRVAFRRLQRLRTWLTYNFWGSVLVVVPMTVYTIRAPEILPGPPGLMFGLSILNVGLAWWTLRSLDRRPFAMVMVMATLHLFFGVWEFLEDGTWQASLVWALILVVIGVDALRIERLARRYPDLYLARRLRDEHLTTRKRHRAAKRGQ